MNHQNQKIVNINERHTSEFRYVLYSNKVEARSDRSQRSIGVLMEKSAFTEENLTKMYKLIAKRYPEPNWLNVLVATSLWQVSTPEEADGGRVSDIGDDEHDGQHPRALLIRYNENEYYRYTAEGPPYKKYKTVVINGVDLQGR